MMQMKDQGGNDARLKSAFPPPLTRTVASALELALKVVSKAVQMQRGKATRADAGCEIVVAISHEHTQNFATVEPGMDQL
jgi:hypothetical protein